MIKKSFSIMKGNDGTGNVSERDLWETEQELWDSLNKQYGFVFDCCASQENTKTWKYSDDFLNVKVGDVEGLAWMNPPFSKALEMFRQFFCVVQCGVAIYRIDNPETRLWQEVIFPKATWIFIPKGRVAYTPYKASRSKGVGSRFPSALIGVNVPPPKGFKGTLLFLKSQNTSGGDDD